MDTETYTPITQHTGGATAAAQLILRLVFGFLFAAHGWQKFFQFTIPGTQASFADMGIPFPETTAVVVATLELVGGILLILGVLTRIVAVLLALEMLASIILVHWPNGIFIADNGFELVLALGAGALACALLGPGPISVGGPALGRRRGTVWLA